MSKYDLMNDQTEVIEKLKELIVAAISVDRTSYYRMKSWQQEVIDFLQENFVEDQIEAEFQKALGFRVTSASIYGSAPPRFKENLPRALKFLRITQRKLENAPLNNLGETVAVQASQAVARTDERIFIVHGHNAELTTNVQRLIENQGLTPVVLSEQPNGGRTIIEKFEENSVVGFAIVLLSADDEIVGAKANYSQARPNVFLELGFFIGSLGRSRVCALRAANSEIPSDILGVVYTDVDSHGAWKYAVLKELRAAGYEVDLNKVS